MSTTESLQDLPADLDVYPGQYLAKAREALGFSQEYVAGKLHLRIRMVELLEQDAYQDLPQPVFVQGYLRAYAKLIGVEPAPILEAYNRFRVPEKKIERILRQRHRDPVFIELGIRWVVAGSVALFFMGFYFWWNHHATSVSTTTAKVVQRQQQAGQTETALTDLSQMDVSTTLSVEEPQAQAATRKAKQE